MSMKLRFVSRMIAYARGMSISGKFVVMYVIVFAIPILIYALILFNSTTRSIQGSYNRQSLESLKTVFDNINRNIEISETVIGTALDNAGFLEFINGDMTQDDLQLIQFKQNEYAQIVNLKNLNPSINNIKFYADNDRIYIIPPILQGKDHFEDQELYTRVVGLQGKEYFKLNYDDMNMTGVPVKVVSLFRGMANSHQHEGIIEVNMLQSEFFKDLYGNPDEKNAILMIADGKDSHSYIFNENSSFYKQRLERFHDFSEQLQPYRNKDGGSFQFETAGEIFVSNYTYVKNLDVYLYRIHSLAGVTDEIRDVRNRIVIAVLAAIVVLGLITNVLSSFLLKKLGVVISSMHKVQAGDLNVTIPVRGGDELDALARHFNNTLMKIKDLIKELLNKQLIAKEAENKALQSQINSHFVYNVLESIRMLAETEEKSEISEAVYSLGRMMRYSMKWKAQQVSLAEEVALIGIYVKLTNIISDVHVDLSIDIAKSLEPYPVPKMSIQPLVENAVIHGLEPQGRGGKVAISAERTEDAIVIAVMDDGVGIGPSQLKQINDALAENQFRLADIELTSGSGIGLVNVHKRIRLLYGEPYGIAVESGKNGGTRVEMRLPYIMNIGGW